MDKAEILPDELKAHLEAMGESQDPEYLAWRDRKVREALEFARKHPEEMISEKEIWEFFGLDY